MASKKNQKKSAGKGKGKLSDNGILRGLATAAGLLFGQKALADDTEVRHEDERSNPTQLKSEQPEKDRTQADAGERAQQAQTDDEAAAQADQLADVAVDPAEATAATLSDEELLALRDQLAQGGLVTDAPVENMDLLAQADAAAGGAATGGTATAGEATAETSAATTGAEGAAAFTLSPLAGIGLGALGLGLVASGGGGGGGRSADSPAPAPAPAPLQPTVEKVSGKVVDAAVKNAKVFYDANDNGKLDDGEIWALTDDEGKFTLEGYTKTANGHLAVEAGGIDTFSGQKVGAMSAAAGYSSINPFTTLLSSGTVDADALLAKLGLTGLDLNTYDPVAVMKSADATPEQKALAQKAFTVGQQINAVIQSAAQLKGRAEGEGVDATEVSDVAAAMAKAIVAGTGDPAALINQATSAALDAALVNSTDPTLDALKDKLSDALINVNEEIAKAYDGISDALASGNAAAIVGAAAIAAISQSALTSAVTSGNTDALDNLADDNALDTLTGAYEDALANLSGGVYSVTGTAAEIDGKLALAPELLDNAEAVKVTDAVTLDQAKRLATIDDISFDVGTIKSAGAATVGYADVSTIINAGLAFTEADVITTATSAAQVAAAAANAAKLKAAGVDQLAGTENLSITDGSAVSLTTGGLHFTDASTVALDATGKKGGTLGSTLKDLQNLKVDTVMMTGAAAGATLGVNLGTGAAIDGAGLPGFNGQLDVTLNFNADQIGEVSGNAAALDSAGIDNLHVNGGTLNDLHLTQANALLGNDHSHDEGDLRFVASDTITLAMDQSDLGEVVAYGGALHDLGVDLLHADAINLSGTQASMLIDAGLAFDAASDAVTMHAGAAGTTLSNSLKDLQKLGVDAVSGSAVAAIGIELGTGTLGGTLPAFAEDLDVTLGFTADQISEVAGNAAALNSAGIDNLHVDGGALNNLYLTQANALLGNDHSYDEGDLRFIDSDDITLALVQADLAEVVSTADGLAGLGVDHLHAGAISLSDAQASALVGAGLDFDAASDAVSLNASGSVLSTSLKDLQKLGVDAVSGGAVVNLALGDGAALSGSLPQFDDAMQVNLGIDDSQLGEALSMAQQLRDAGIDTLHFNDGTGTVTLEDLSYLLGSDHEFKLGEDLQFTSSDEITLVGSPETMEGLGQAAPILQDIGIDHLQFGSATIGTNEAAALIDAGIDFVASDDVTLNVTNAEGTHLSNSLKDLQKLGVDVVSGAAGMHVAVDLGHGATDFGGLPQFADDLDVTLNVDANQYADIAAHLDALTAAGIDDIRLHGTASELAALPLLDDVSHIAGITLDVADAHALDSMLADTSALAGLPDISGVRIDKLDVANGSGGAAELHISDAGAAAMIEAGLSFESSDNVELNVGTVAGTHVSTSFDDLHKLGVDEVVVHYDSPVPVGDTRDEMVNVDVLRSYDDQLDVTLDIGNRFMPQGADTIPAFQKLADKGIDHVAVSDSFDLLSDDALNELAGITDATGIDFELQLQSAAGTANLDQQLQGIDLLGGFTTADKYGDLVAALSDSGVHNLVLDGGSVQVSDALAATLVDAGMLQAAAATDLALDASQSNGHLHTSLKEMADLGVDAVNTGSSGKVYVDLGIQSDTNALEEIKALLGSFDSQPLFGGGSNATLVLDSKVANAISHNGGIDEDVLAKLSAIGIHEIDVLVASGESSGVVAQTMSQVPVEVKLIGQDVDAMLFDELHKAHK